MKPVRTKHSLQVCDAYSRCIRSVISRLALPPTIKHDLQKSQSLKIYFRIMETGMVCTTILKQQHSVESISKLVLFHLFEVCWAMLYLQTLTAQWPWKCQDKSNSTSSRVLRPLRSCSSCRASLSLEVCLYSVLNTVRTDFCCPYRFSQVTSFLFLFHTVSLWPSELTYPVFRYPSNRWCVCMISKN